MRKSTDDFIIFVCNFTPVPLLNHRIGVPFVGFYKEIFNSDDLKYGGSGITNKDLLVSEKIDYNGRENSIGIEVPPLGITVFKISS